ncbi:MAG: pantoate--beta-alanine ligase [Planctomycetota bacterium]|nr:MAG: pantoate--beta-alanine ligase [Planctomycetota bacterium]
MERIDHPVLAAQWCDKRRARGARIGFVPTMGALHDGHLALVRRAREENDVAVVSIFVNPLQFNDPRDYELYPRDFGADAVLLDVTGAAMAFTGTLAQFFPGSGGDLANVPLRDPGAAAEGLEGERRPGHFAGVATIVARLFELVKPARAYFGEKDFQQTRVVLELARALGGPPIEVCPTLREPSGLAMSSRNARLSPQQRVDALALSRALYAAQSAWQKGERDADALCALLARVAGASPLRIEYAEVRDPERWTAARPRGALQRAQGLLAAYCGDVRLIDTLRLDGAPR